MSNPTVKNPLATAVSLILPGDPAIDVVAMRDREAESLSDKERAAIVDKIAKATREALKLDSDVLVSVSAEQMDDAITSRAVAKYTKAYDPALLLFKQGETPSVFTVSPLSPGFLASRIDSDEATPIMAKAILCVRAGAHSVKCADGLDLAATMVPGSEKQLMADEDWAAVVRDKFGQSALYELGFAVMNLSRLPASARPTLRSSAG